MMENKTMGKSLLESIRELDACPECERKIKDGYVNDTPVMYLPGRRALWNSVEKEHLRGCDACLYLVIDLVRTNP